MHEKTQKITELIIAAKEKAVRETSNDPEPELTQPIKWPVQCTVGPGLEGAIACETNIGYVNGSKGWLIYSGYNIFDLCAYSTFEEVSYLLLFGALPTKPQLKAFKQKLVGYRHIPSTKRILMNFPIENMNSMSALRLGTSLLRDRFTELDQDGYIRDSAQVIGADEDSIPMETAPMGEKHAIYEFQDGEEAANFEASYQLIAGLASLAAAISRVRNGHLPIESDPQLSHAANLLYMMTGKVPTPTEERVMDVILILHADHGMNASTFAAMVVASTLADIFHSIGSGISALQGPLHGGANEQVIRMLQDIGKAENVKPWYQDAVKNKRKISGFGHRVYKAYDPRARVLGPLAAHLIQDNPEFDCLYRTALQLEAEVVGSLGKNKKIFPNVDYYSGIVYSCLGIAPELFTPLFAVSRVSGWTARILEYLKHNRIFRPRAMYTGSFDNQYTPIKER